MKRLLKILAWVAGILAVLIILLVIGVKLFLPAEKIKAMAVEEATTALNREVSIGDLDISFWGGLGVKLVDVAVGNPEWIEQEDFLRADNVDVKLQLWPLISGEYRVDRLIVNSPRIHMLKTADGANNFTLAAVDKKLPPDLVDEVPAETKTAAAAVSFKRLEVRDGRIEYVDDSTGTTMRLAGFDLSTSLETPRPGLFESSGELSADSILVIAKDTLPPLAMKLNYEAVYDYAERHLSVPEAELELNGLQFGLEGELRHPPGSMSARGRVKSKRISVEQLLALLPP
jgi:uncharacterized protein involved in outer membrane biogenesis